MPRTESVKRLSMTLQEKCMQEREKLRIKTMKKLKDDMHSLFLHAPGADLTIQTREGKFYVHRLIVEQRMPLLLQDLGGDDDVVNFSQVGMADARELFRLIYMTDDLSLATEMAAGYLTSSADNTPQMTPTMVEDRTPPSQPVPDLVQGLDSSTSSTDGTCEIQSPSSETPGGSSSSYPPTPVEESLPSFVSVPAYLVGAPDVPYLPASGLGLDLLRLFLHSKNGDVVIQVGDEEFKGHKFLLMNRCKYFEMMYGGAWAESNSGSVKLTGVSPSAFHQALLYMYGGVIDLDTDCNVQDLLILADMYNMDGLKDVVSFEIKKNFCHFFHKPCPECIAKVSDALLLSHHHNMDDVFQRVLRWCNKHFVKMWPTQQFADLPKEILDKCCGSISTELTKDTVTDIIFDCDKLKGSIPQVKWADSVNHLTEQLMEACKVYLQNNLFEVLESQSFSDLGRNMAWSLNFLEEVITTTVKEMPHTVSCKTFMSAYRLCEHADSEDCGWNDDFKVFIRNLTEKCRQNLKNNISYLEFTPEFEQLPSTEQKTIKEAGTRYVIKHLPRQPSYLSPGASFVSVGDNKAKRSPPKLSSDNKKFTQKKHGGIPFNLPRGVPPKSKLSLKPPDGTSSQEPTKKPSTVKSHSSSSSGAKASTSGTQTKTKTGQSGAVGEKRPLSSSTKSRVSSSSVAQPTLTKKKTDASQGSSRPSSAKDTLNRSVDNVRKPGRTQAGGARWGVNRSFDSGAKKLDKSSGGGPAAAKKSFSCPKPTRSVPASRVDAAVAGSSGGEMRKKAKKSTQDSAGGAVGGETHGSPSSDSGVSSVGSAAEGRSKRKARRSLDAALQQKEPDVSLNVSMPANPIAQSTPRSKPSKLRQPQVHSPTKTRPPGDAVLFKVPKGGAVRKANIGSRDKKVEAPGGAGGILAKDAATQNKNVKKRPATATSKDSEIRRSRLPVRSPERKTVKASPAKSLPCSPGVASRSNSRHNQSSLPLPSHSRRSLSAAGRLSFTSQQKLEKEKVPRKPENFCNLCNGPIDTGMNKNVVLPESEMFSFEIMPVKFLDVTFKKP